MVKFHGELEILEFLMKMVILETLEFAALLSLVCWVLIEGVAWSPRVQKLG
jgi:hypothetical protein